MRAGTFLAWLDAAGYKYASTQACRSIIKGLPEPFRSMASLLLLTDSLDIAVLCVGFMWLSIHGKASFGSGGSGKSVNNRRVCYAVAAPLSVPPSGYVCHTCELPGHYRSDYPKGDCARGGGRGGRGDSRSRGYSELAYEDVQDQK